MKEEQLPPGTSRAASLADGKLTAGLDAEPSGLAGLLAKVEVATGDNEAYDRIGYRVSVALLGRDPAHRFLYAPAAQQAPARSLDSALVLLGRVLPGWTWSVGNLARGGHAYLQREGGALYGGKAATPALALLAALLRARAAISKAEGRS